LVTVGDTEEDIIAIDPLDAARQRALRTGRSYFPAANTTSYGSGYSIPSPENNPEYLAAINRPRLGRGDLTTIRLPSGGTTTIPTTSAGFVAQGLPGSQVTQIGNQLPVDYAANYRKGYGAPAPFIQNTYVPINRPGVSVAQLSGSQLVQGGVANPVENLTPAQRIQYGVGMPLDYLRSNPALSAFGGLGQSFMALFRGNGNTPSLGPASATAGAVPTPTPPPIPTATPFKTASERGDLMNDINGTFYGGGQAPPVPTPTPTPYQAPNMAYEPRRYFDYYA